VHVGDPVLVHPGVTPLALGVEGRRVLGAGYEREAAEALANDARTLLPVLLREPALPHVRRLHHVVVDADDLGNLTHARNLPRWRHRVAGHGTARRMVRSWHSSNGPVTTSCAP